MENSLAHAHWNRFHNSYSTPYSQETLHVLWKCSNSLAQGTPYNILAAIAIPNFEKAFQSTAENQTKINQAALACALERFKNARGHYPESLDELKPVFMANIPHDIIGGQPLHYHRASDKFVLYSVGWNQTDDGGTPGASREQGDWVWGE
jgi:hypothetical protein